MAKIITFIKITILVIIATMLGALCLVACGSETGNKLETPKNIRITNEILEWDEVKNADGYAVEINGEEYETDTNSLDIMLIAIEPKTYTMRVMAYAEFNRYSDSAWSDSVEYTVGFPKGLMVRAINNNTEYEIGVADKTAIEGKVIIPSKYSDGKPITQISSNCFYNCTKLTSVIIPNSVTVIGKGAFEGCNSLSRVRLPEFLEIIESYTFEGCTSLKEIEIPRSVRTISFGAITKCESLESITIPETTESIGMNNFSDCNSLNIITVEERNSTYKSDGNCIIRISDSAVIAGCNASVIPEYVKKIEEVAFAGCFNMKQMQIPNGVESIGRLAFSRCMQIEEITIPGSVQDIGFYAFAQCFSLKSVTIQDGVKSISYGNSMGGIFEACKSLETVELPKSLESIHFATFSGCSLLKTITIEEGNPVFKSEGNCLIRKSDGELVFGGIASEIPDYVENIGIGAFWGRAITHIVPKGAIKTSDVTNDMTLLELPENIVTIRNSAFRNCLQLEYVVLPYATTTINNSAFYNCINLESIMISENVTYLGQNFSVDNPSEDPCTTIYTELTEIPQGWEIFKIDTSCYTAPTVVLGCTIGYDGDLPYVQSFTYIYDAKYEDDGSVDYIMTIRNVSYLNWYVQSPLRMGYTYEGWAVEPNSNNAVYVGVLFIGNSTAVGKLENSYNSGTQLYVIWKAKE